MRGSRRSLSASPSVQIFTAPVTCLHAWVRASWQQTVQKWHSRFARFFLFAWENNVVHTARESKMKRMVVVTCKSLNLCLAYNCDTVIYSATVQILTTLRAGYSCSLRCSTVSIMLRSKPIDRTLREGYSCSLRCSTVSIMLRSKPIDRWACFLLRLRFLQRRLTAGFNCSITTAHLSFQCRLAVANSV
jgi:hypothetical protein